MRSARRTLCASTASLLHRFAAQLTRSPGFATISPMATRTGSFPIGFRRAGVEWQKDLSKLAKWSKQSGFDVIDLTHHASADDFATLKSAGLTHGAVDLLDFGQIMASDT